MEKSYSNVAENIKRIQNEIGEAVVRYNRKPSDVRLMAVTKTVPPKAVNEAIAHGVTLLGENKAQELLSKFDEYDRENTEIHFIGHLQSNKVKMIIGKVDMIQSVDSAKLAREINSQAGKISKTANILAEVNIGGEDTKSGVSPNRLEELLCEIAPLPSVRVMGLMTIPPVCESSLELEKYFYAMQELIVDIKAKNIDNVSMDILSMGMSGDFVLAIKHGSNIVRVGTAIFGARNYTTL